MAATPESPEDVTLRDALRDPIQAGLRNVLDAVAPQTGGEVADYIPELAAADPEPFGIALTSMAGRTYGVGDCDTPFTIQSISKAFVYALAVEDHGMEQVLARVGVEPSGEAFNAIKLEPGTGRPPNPMVNAGALMTTSLVRAQYPEERLERIISVLSAFAGRRLEVDEAVAAGELNTASRNRALAYLMEGAGSLREPVEEVLWTYCQQCAILVTATDLAVMAATLAGGGVNPVTGKAVVDEDVAVRTLAVMATCGMYDYSGEWLLRVGLPAKSGVAGGLIAVSPAEFGIGTFSPRLDDHGNSVRGIATARAMADRFDLHLMHHSGETAPVVYREEREYLPAGGQVVTIAAQGTLEFSAAEQFLAAIDAADDGGGGIPPAAAFIIDLHRITRAEDLSFGLFTARISALLKSGKPVAIVQREHLKAELPTTELFSGFAKHADALAWIRTRG